MPVIISNRPRPGVQITCFIGPKEKKLEYNQFLHTCKKNKRNLLNQKKLQPENIWHFCLKDVEKDESVIEIVAYTFLVESFLLIIIALNPLINS